MQTVGDAAGNASTMFLAILVLTLITYIGNFLKCICALFGPTCIGIVGFFVFTFVEIGGYLGLIIVYGISHKSLKAVDVKALRYGADNNCSDSVLQRSMTVYADNYDHDLMLIGLGFFFVVTSFVVIYGTLLIFGPCRECFSRCCTRLKEPTSFERKMTSMRTGVVQRYQTFRARGQQEQKTGDPNAPPIDVMGPMNEPGKLDHAEIGLDVKPNTEFVLNDPHPQAPPSLNYNYSVTEPPKVEGYQPQPAV